MPLVPVVVVEIPADLAPALANATITSCNLALGAGHCAVVDPVQGASKSAWIAEVHLEPADPNRLRVELRDATPQPTLVRFTRDLTFEGPESGPHRWSTVGVVVAALVISAESASRSGTTETPSSSRDVPAGNQPKDSGKSAPPKSPPNPPAVQGPSPSPAPPNRREFRVDFGGILGPGIEAGAPRWGGLLRVSVEVLDWAFFWSRGSIVAANQSVEFWGWSGAIGPGFVLTSKQRLFGIEGRIGVTTERVFFSATKDSRTERGDAFRAGGVAGVDLTLGISRPIALWLGGELTASPARVDINVAKERTGQLDRVNGSLTVGFRTRFNLGAQ